MAKIDPFKTLSEKLEHSFQVFFELFFDKDKFVVWIIGVILCGLFLIIIHHYLFKKKSCLR